MALTDETPQDLPESAPAEVQPTDASFRAIYNNPISLGTAGQSRYTLPTGTGRCVMIKDWTQHPLYVNFGAANVVANPGQGFRMDYGTAQFIIPDDATTMVLHSDDANSVVAQFGWAER